MDTALVMLVPEAEALVAPWREHFDPAAAEGVPAHITLMVPFRPWSEIDGRVHATLTALFAAQAPIELAFNATGGFPVVLWLAPEPRGPIIRLTEEITRGFPDCRPYGGAFSEIVPHLTVAHVDDPAGLERIAAEFGSAASKVLPIRARVANASLLHKENGRWMVRRHYRLGA